MQGRALPGQQGGESAGPGVSEWLASTAGAGPHAISASVGNAADWVRKLTSAHCRAFPGWHARILASVSDGKGWRAAAKDSLTMPENG